VWWWHVLRGKNEKELTCIDSLFGKSEAKILLGRSSRVLILFVFLLDVYL
jgi:hypothetical protein